MVCKIMVGTIKPDKINTWNENKDPFGILNDCRDITQIDWITFLNAAGNLFTEEVKLDWGSFAYKATKEQLNELIESHKAKIDGLEDLPDVDLGIVFVEMS